MQNVETNEKQQKHRISACNTPNKWYNGIIKIWLWIAAPSGVCYVLMYRRIETWKL